MNDGNTTKKADRFPGTQVDWNTSIDPAIKNGIVENSDIELHVLRGGVEDGVGISDFFSSLRRDDGWHDRIVRFNSLIRSVTIRSSKELKKANILRLMARLTPRHSPFLFEEVLKRDGFEDIKVPNLSSVLVGAVPEVLAGHSVFGVTMERIAKNWYEGDRSKMAGDIGVDTKALDRIIKGEDLPKRHADVVKIAEGLGVDSDVLDVAWFADKKARVVHWFMTEPNGQSRGTTRAIIMNWLAAARLGEEFIPFDSSQDGMERYLELAVFALRAGIHPRTVIPVIASIGEGSEGVFDDVVTYAEELALDGWTWKAAILCYMAANDAEFRVDYRALTSLVHLGNNYLLNSEKAMPEFMSQAHARELQHYHLQWGLDLHRSSADSSPEVAARPSAGAVDTNADQGFAGIVRSAEPDYGVPMTPQRREFIGQFKKACPELWEEVERAGRYDIVGRVLELADPHRNRSAISFVTFNMTMRALAEREGIIDRDFGKSMSNAEFIAEGAEIYFGDHKMWMYEGKLYPVFETHIGEEFISVGQQFLTAPMLATMINRPLK